MYARNAEKDAFADVKRILAGIFKKRKAATKSSNATET
jgi:hypothetical protein